MCASHWVAKPKGAMKVKVSFGLLIRDPVITLTAQRSPVPTACSGVARRAYTLGPERW